MNRSEMIVAGLMSGTSADGIDVALVRISDQPSHSRDTRRRGRGRLRLSLRACPEPAEGAGPRHTIRLVGHVEFPYPPKVRSAVLAAMNASSVSVAELSRLNFLLGELYAEAVQAAQRRFRVKIDLVGCHGQTLYHQGEATKFLGHSVAVTWQTGEAAVIAARVGVPVVSDFRPADMAAGGKGAPLVPYLDFLWFRDDHIGRIAQNLGGIANLTAIPASGSVDGVIAFDTGPGNMVIDAVTETLFGHPFDRDGKIAARGEVIEPVIAAILRNRFFRARPPKTAGREEFGREFVRDFFQRCGRAKKQDVVATATALTARSIADAIERFVLPERKANFREMVLSGGGAKNSTLVGMMTECLAPLGVQLRFSDEFGLPSEAKEAVAFALLAYETWNRRPSNVPSATGAKRVAVLGKISYA